MTNEDREMTQEMDTHRETKRAVKWGHDEATSTCNWTHDEMKRISRCAYGKIARTKKPRHLEKSRNPSADSVKISLSLVFSYFINN